MAATRTGAARVPRRNGNEPAAVPCQLVIQLAAKLKPALIENGFVQAGFGPNVLARLLVVPAADLDMFRTRKSSIHTIAWFWLIVVVALCR